MTVRRLVVNADDFGFTRDVNAGIAAAHRDGILTATTLMANGAAFDDALRLAQENPRLEVGVHGVLVAGPSLARPGALLPASPGALVRALALGRLDVEAELRAQIERILAAGLRPLHLDLHKHTHLVPGVLRVAARLAREYKIPWVRRPFDCEAGGPGVPWRKKVVSRGLKLRRGSFTRTLLLHGCHATEFFHGFQWTGRYTVAMLAGLIGRLRPGTTEFMCHPGYSGAELQAAATRLKASRADELAVLCDAQVRAALAAAGVELTGYRDLPIR